MLEKKGRVDSRKQRRRKERKGPVNLQSTHSREGRTVDRGELRADQREHKESTPRSNEPSLVSRVTAQVMVQNSCWRKA